MPKIKEAFFEGAQPMLSFQIVSCHELACHIALLNGL